MLTFKQFFPGFYAYLRSNRRFFVIPTTLVVVIDNTKSPKVTHLSGTELSYLTRLDLADLAKLPPAKFIARLITSPTTFESTLFSPLKSSNPTFQVFDIVQISRTYAQRLEYLKLMDLSRSRLAELYVPNHLVFASNSSYERIWDLLRNWMAKSKTLILRKQDHILNLDFDIYLQDISIKRCTVVDKKVKGDQFYVICKLEPNKYVTIIDGVDEDRYLQLKVDSIIEAAYNNRTLLGVFIRQLT